MPQPAQRLVALLALAVVAALGGTIATGRLGLGGSGGDAQAGQIVDRAFGGGDKLKSGRFDTRLNFQLAGAATQLQGPVSAQATGVFQEERTGTGTDMELDATINVLGRDSALRGDRHADRCLRPVRWRQLLGSEGGGSASLLRRVQAEDS